MTKLAVVILEEVDSDDNVSETVFGVYSSGAKAQAAIDMYKEKFPECVIDDFTIELFELDSECGICEDSWIAD